MNLRNALCTAAALLVVGSGCDVVTPDLDQAGTVEFLSLEGGCWTIESQDETYLPINLPEELREDGLAVEFEATVRDDIGHRCMAGTIVELLRIREAP